MRRLLLISCLAAASAVQAESDTTYRWEDQAGQVHYSDLPPPPDARNVQERHLGSPNFVEADTLPYALRKAAQDFPVTLYTSGNCGAPCQDARAYLQRRGVPYTDTPLDDSEGAAAAYRKAFATSDVFVPSLTVGTQPARGFQEDSWSRLLDSAGYPR